GSLRRIVSPLGRVHDFSYDEQQRLTQARDPRGSVVTLAYDEDGRLACAEGDANHHWGFEWNQHADLRTLGLAYRTNIGTDFSPTRQVVSHARGDDLPVRLERDERG